MKATLSCKQATELVEKRENFGLSKLENLKLKFHLSMCSSCSKYSKQSILLDRALSSAFKNDLDDNVKFTDEAKKKITENCIKESKK